MSLRVRPHREEAIKALLANLAEHVEFAQAATNTQDTRQALRLVRDLTLDAFTALNEAEREARDDAEEALRRRHAETLASLTGEAA